MLNMKILKVNFFDGPENIVCSNDPIQGRSGGGLFNAKGELIGVCSGAFRKTKEGLYTGIGAVRKLITNLKLTELFEPSSTPSFVAAAQEEDAGPTANPFQADDDYFEQMFADGESAFSNEEFTETETAEIETSGLPSGDVFATNSQPPPRTRLAASSLQSETPEITVIIDDPKAGKQVVVIPKPSPFLMQLLPGRGTVHENGRGDHVTVG